MCSTVSMLYNMKYKQYSVAVSALGNEIKEGTSAFKTLLGIFFFF